MKSTHPFGNTDYHDIRCNVLNAIQQIQINALNDRIKRLEEAGDALCAAAAFMGWHMEIEKWNKSKEAKP